MWGYYVLSNIVWCNCYYFLVTLPYLDKNSDIDRHIFGPVSLSLYLCYVSCEQYLPGLDDKTTKKYLV
jgi:hypothetical protein